MSGNRWWDVFVGTAIVVLALLAGLTFAPTEGQRIGAWVTLGVLTLAYLTMGRTALRTGRFAVPFSLLLIVASGVVVGCSPKTAVIQAISFPLIWTLIESTRFAIVANVALALAVSAGFIVSLGATADNYLQTAVIESISLVGSLALGLWISRIAELSNERKLLLEELTAAQQQLSALSRDSGVMSERERLAREIHDTIAQSLTGVVMLSQRAQRELAGGNLAPLAEQLELLEESARDALVETRSLVAASAPIELGAGIAPALERLAARFQRETGIAVSVRADAAADLDRDTEVVLLRSAQEALANVRKHSGAVSASLDLHTLDGRTTLTARDDGDGFDPTTPTSGFGLPGMRDRLALVGGGLEIVSAPGSGTTLKVSLPLVVTT
ncbi:sensor histidine kinase [Glaciihabitans sp. UYNi722]|uniref:sensor histidine kinase n=1 Tax=Glaciihabitans sp. UYNi722 TaxID=3156344 RepID=UPI00339897F4